MTRSAFGIVRTARLMLSTTDLERTCMQMSIMLSHFGMIHDELPYFLKPIFESMHIIHHLKEVLQTITYYPTVKHLGSLSIQDLYPTSGNPKMHFSALLSFLEDCTYRQGVWVKILSLRHRLLKIIINYYAVSLLHPAQF